MVNIKSITLLFLGVLICSEIKISIYDAYPYKFSVVEMLMYMTFSLPPLLMIIAAVYKKLLIIPAWIVIIVGGYFHYVFYTPSYNSHDILIMLIPWFIYWGIGAYSLVKLTSQSD